MKIYPSLISADLLNLKKTIEMLDNHCDGYHLDIMDDHFVPNLTWGPMFINAIAGITTRPLHVHLMVTNPATWLDRLDLSIKDTFTFHVEAVKEPTQIKEFIMRIHEYGTKAGIAINPRTDIAAITPFLSILDEVLVMSVDPGFSGQEFIDVTNKVDELRTIRSEKKLTFEIGMDGGINAKNIRLIAQHEVDFVGVASAIFNEKDIVKGLQTLYSLVI